MGYRESLADFPPSGADQCQGCRKIPQHLSPLGGCLIRFEQSPDLSRGGEFPTGRHLPARAQDRGLSKVKFLGCLRNRIS